ncbi:hypothetical protein POM88_042026 [Heracleum sosnowskyi]|uniref:Fungal lipase-type domain-containing protein n=1 Tax=Heracleum sosnowskyi TaxID=360622 RepID=A0AAD8M8V4_9APIA|nr:hypothetical protein POM88_042026 [Heracleum sosnowskyi]
MAFRQLEFKHSGPTLLTATNWNNIQHRRSIAACLVQGVYILEEDRQDHRTLHHALAPPWWNSFNFELLPQVLIDDSDSSIFGAIYKFESPLNTSCKCVVAFRGINRCEKLVDDAGAANVWLAGHSLGSLIALLVGRNMVKMGFLVETYLFNPPFASLSRLVERIIKKQISKFMARIIGDVIRA